MADLYELGKKTKYLLLFITLLLLLGVIFVVQGFVRPWLSQPVVVFHAPTIHIDQELLRSEELARFSRFNHIDYPDQDMGRRDLLNWPPPEADLEE